MYPRIFGAMIVMSFCDFNFIKQNFFFLKSTSGRGWFDLFCSFMFLATSSNSIMSWVMMGILMACGVFFIFVGYCYKVDPAGGDMDTSALKKQALLSAASS